MAEISTQAVIDAITLAIRAAYPNAGILDDVTMQGVTPGTFNVRLVSADQQKFTGPRYRRAPLFDVIYYSNNSDPECVAVADSLSMTLDAVATPGGDVLHGSGVEWHIEDFVLHFMVQYTHFVRCDTPQTFMETLNFRGGVGQ